MPLELDIEALQEVITCKLIQPVKGYRKKLLEMASNNAKTNLLQKFEVMERQNETTEESMRQLAQKLRIPGLSRIEIFDNSHISGALPLLGWSYLRMGCRARTTIGCLSCIPKTAMLTR